MEEKAYKSAKVNCLILGSGLFLGSLGLFLPLLLAHPTRPLLCSLEFWVCLFLLNILLVLICSEYPPSYVKFGKCQKVLLVSVTLSILLWVLTIGLIIYFVFRPDFRQDKEYYLLVGVLLSVVLVGFALCVFFRHIRKKPYQVHNFLSNFR